MIDNEKSYKSEVEFKLSKSIVYQGDSEDTHTDTITLRAPSIEHEDLIDELSALVVRSLFAMGKLVSTGESESTKKEDESKKASLSAKQVMLSLTANKELKTAKKLFKKLLLGGCGLVTTLPSKIVMTDWHMSQILSVPPKNDFQNMMETFFENFTLPSWMELLDMTKDT